ncbi:lipocalin family protein [Parapedobacter lycopersici]|uniref:lipocalin family protein n=1 Tax=Parapedobacter lycopersici TaxID=1864939 RepID=UPI003342A2F3
MNNRLIGYIGALALAGAGVMLYQSRKTIPEKAQPVQPFDVKRYLGKWYEIARIDHRFERNLNNVTAEYGQAANGRIRVLNRGFNTKTDRWEQAEGKAMFVGNTAEARLKVSFFGPFYSGYNVIAIDPDYRYALVAGENLRYLWMLSRETTIPDTIRDKYLQVARSVGYDTGTLTWTEHDREQQEPHVQWGD